MAIDMPKSRANIIIAVCAILLVGISGVAVYLFKQNIELRNNPESVTQETSDRIIGKVSELYEVPVDEKPTIAEVQEKDKLKDQPFFKNAENGDHILIYANSKIAILYRESTNKIINVGPIAIDSQNDNQQQTEDKSQ